MARISQIACGACEAPCITIDGTPYSGASPVDSCPRCGCEWNEGRRRRVQSLRDAYGHAHREMVRLATELTRAQQDAEAHGALVVEPAHWPAGGEGGR